jgi:hypothetical protein
MSAYTVNIRSVVDPMVSPIGTLRDGVLLGVNVSEPDDHVAFSPPSRSRIKLATPVSVTAFQMTQDVRSALHVFRLQANGMKGTSVPGGEGDQKRSRELAAHAGVPVRNARRFEEKPGFGFRHWDEDLVL